MKRLATVIAPLIVLLTASARADIIPLDVAECSSKAAGEACSLPGDRGAGTCVQATCSRVLPTGQEDYACIRCVPAQAEPEPATPAPAAPTAAPAPATKSSKCDAGGAEGLVALGVALALVARRRRQAA